jgi:prepilin-type N-terminal cleavage/methylation domain-containing protein/prepilin-type processing-associated H-X9-DG protein
MRRRRGFTLIELLVVIAIIGILAAMLFPVFARARESARKIQCLSNVKNIAMAFQMYLTDYDSLPPKEHRAEVIDLFCGNEPSATGKNPYLRIPVILDEYIKNRDVWRCPSAKYAQGAMAIMPGPDWFKIWVSYSGGANCASDAFAGTSPFPPGWGGSITDSFTQGRTGLGRAGEVGGATGAGAFEQTIGTTACAGRELKTSAVNDPAKYIVCGDSGIRPEYMKLSDLAYPDVCKVEASPGCYADWDNCPDTQRCGLTEQQARRFWADSTVRRQYTRHFGGSNMGFLDGHAAWMSSDAIYANSSGGQRNHQDTFGDLVGVAACHGCFCRYCEAGDKPNCSCGG